MNNFYPNVDFSYNLIEISKDEPVFPKEPSKPIKPSEPKIESKEPGCGTHFFSGIGVFGSVFCVSALFISEFQIALIFGGVAVVSFICLYIIYKLLVDEELQNNEKIRQYKLKCIKYEEELLTYKMKYDDYESKIKILNSSDYINNHRRKLLENQYEEDRKLLLRLLRKMYAYSSSVTVFFEPYLLDKFSNRKLLQSVMLEDFLIKFLLFDELGVIINIEIDEPYFVKNGLPKNTTDDINDSKFERIRLLKKYNITTVRFCEEQIFKFPNDCVNFISKVIRALHENKIYIFKEEFPHKFPMWTKAEAYSMAYNRYRYTYIPEKYHNQLKRGLLDDFK